MRSWVEILLESLSLENNNNLGNVIRKRIIEERRKEVMEKEKRGLLRYMQPDQSYGLMSEIYLKKHFT